MKSDTTLARAAGNNRSRPSNHDKVYAVLKAANRPLTAYEVIDAVRPQGISAPPTVYRALNRLIEEGLAHRLESVNAYVACRQDHNLARAPIFMICSVCGDAKELGDQTVGAQLISRATDRGFRVDAMTVELRGQCSSCVKTNETESAA